MADANEPKIANSELRLTLSAIQQVIGEASFRDIIKQVDTKIDLNNLPPDDGECVLPARDFAQLLATIKTAYGTRGTRILIRIGRSTFHQVLREQKNWMATAQQTMTLWKPERRIALILESIKDSNQKIYPKSESWIESKDGKNSLIEQNCLDCRDRKSSAPVCFYKAGFLSEAVTWATGREYDCQETACIANGDPYCKFTIDKNPSRKESTR